MKKQKEESLIKKWEFWAGSILGLAIGMVLSLIGVWKMYNQSYYIMYTLLIIALVISVLGLIDSFTSETIRTEHTKCYDEFRNEMIGQQCIKETKCGIILKAFTPTYCYGDKK